MAKQPKGEPKDSTAKKSRTTNGFTWLYLLLLGLFFALIYSYIFDTKINLGGDNAGYYILGKSISSGQGYSNIHMPNNPPHHHFPPGYPLILGAFMLISESIIFLKVVNGLFLLGSSILMFALVRQIFDNQRLAFVAAAVMLLNMHLLSYSTIMMSEIPFLFFSILILYLFLNSLKQENPFKHPQLYAVIGLSAYAFHIRSAGLALLGGIMLYLLLRKRWSYLAAYAGGFIALSLPWFLRGRSIGGNSYINQLFMINPYRPEEGMMGIGDFVSRFVENLMRYVGKEIPNGLFPGFTVDYQSDVTSGGLLFGALLLAGIAYGIYRMPKYRDLFLWYFLGTFAILLLWPEVWFGIRFLLPLIPFLSFLFLYGIYCLLDSIVKKIGSELSFNPLLLLICVLFFFDQLKALNINADKRYDSRFQNYFDMAEWVRENTPADAVVACRKPSLFYLFANRKTSGFLNTTDYNDFIQHMNDNDVTHVIIDGLGFSSTGRYLVPVIRTNPYRFQSILQYNNPETYLLAYKKDVGYVGEWKDQGEGQLKVKEGKGVFTYEDGSRFEGTWVNNLREGVGTMIYPDGNRVVARYENDRVAEIIDSPDTTAAQ